MPFLSSLLTLTLAAGLAGGIHLGAPFTLMVSLTMSAAWVAAVLAFRGRYTRMQLVAVSLLIGGAGWVLGAHAVDRALHPPLRVLLEQRIGGFGLDNPSNPFAVGGVSRSGEPIVVEGRLRADAASTETGAVLRVDVERAAIHGAFESAQGGVSLGVSGAMQRDHVGQWTAGRMIRAPVVLRRPARYLNDGLTDQERALAQRGVSLVGTIKSAALVEVVERGRWWEETAAAVRARTRQAIERHVESGAPDSAAIAAAILIGDRAGLSLDVERRLQEAGTYHVIAISGGNVAILAGLLLGLMRLIGVRGQLASMSAIGGLAAYALIAAGGASVLRATLMAVVYLAVRLIDQRTAAANAISLACAVVLIIDPLALVDVGFWLTFGATIALVTAASPISWRPNANLQGAPNRSPSIATTLAYAVVAVFAASVCVEIALAPISALVFQRITVAGLVLNYLALPAMTVVQVGAMAVVAFDLANLSRAAASMGQVVHLASVVLTESARLLEVAPWLTWRVPAPHAAVLTAYYVTLVTAVAMLARGRPKTMFRALAGVCATLLLWIVAAPAARVRTTGDGRLHLTLLDVGQGDSMLVTFPNGRTLLVDAGGGAPGGEFDVGDRVVGPTLRGRGWVGLDYLAVTHGDPDHIGGARAVLRDFAPREVWWGVPVANHELTAVVRRQAERQRIAWRTLQRFDRIDIGGVAVRVHHPPPPDWERQKTRNNDSLVIELRFGAVSMLLTGDIGREVEQDLVSSLDLASTVVLKVPHHGSGTSSSPQFLDKLRPIVALIGVGRGNPYGHPLPSVLGRLRDVGAEVFRTDLDGQIEVTTDGVQVMVRTFTGRTFEMQHEGHEGHEGNKTQERQETQVRQRTQNTQNSRITRNSQNRDGR